MSIGYPVTKVDLDNRMGGMIVEVRNSLLACVQFKAGFLDDAVLGPDPVLTALSYSGTEITAIRNSFTSMKLLSDVAKGLQTVPSVVDFYFDAKKLIGLNV